MGATKNTRYIEISISTAVRVKSIFFSMLFSLYISCNTVTIMSSFIKILVSILDRVFKYKLRYYEENDVINSKYPEFSCYI